MLQGKWVWIWNWGNCDGGDLDRVAARLRNAGCAGAFVKAGDGGHDFGQSMDVVSIIGGLRERGLQAEPWFYWYGKDAPEAIYGVMAYTWREEGTQLVDACRRVGANFAIIDVEVEYEKPADPASNARRALTIVRDALPDLDLYYAPLAQPDYHRALPYAVFNEFCLAVLPQAYHNAMQVSPARAVQLCYDAFASEGLTSRPLLPAGGAYDTVTAAELREWASLCIGRGATALSWWSCEHMSEALWQAVGVVPLTAEEDEVSQQKLNELENRMTKAEGRLDSHEKMVRAGVKALAAKIKFLAACINLHHPKEED